MIKSYKKICTQTIPKPSFLWCVIVAMLMSTVLLHALPATAQTDSFDSVYIQSHDFRTTITSTHLTRANKNPHFPGEAYQFGKKSPSKTSNKTGAWELSNFGELAPVQSNTFPWAVNVKLKMESSIVNGRILQGSGILIDPLHVLTAGHNVFEFNNQTGSKDWVKSALVIPGYENGNEPFGRKSFSVYLLDNLNFCIWFPETRSLFHRLNPQI